MASGAHLPRLSLSLSLSLLSFPRPRRAPAAAAAPQPPSPPGLATAAAAARKNCADRRLPPPRSPQAEAQEPVDPKPRIEKECHKPCERQWAEYEKCKLRIAKAKEGSCEPWVFDYW